jgi:Glycosyltransferases involved in cell wall biogenesis
MYKITIVTVCYNCKGEIRKTIDSVLSQNRCLIEYVIIDGASNDGTMDIVDEYKNHIDYIISEPDKGIYDAMNKGINIASGKYINFMNAGDTFYDNNVISRIAEEANDNSDVIFGDVAVVKDCLHYQVKATPFYNNLPLHQNMGFNHQCTFVRTLLAKKFPFNLRYKLAADYDMIINLYKNKAVFQQINFIIAEFNLQGASNIKAKQHIFERLTVDHPERYIINKWIAEFRSTKLLLLKLLKKYLMLISPLLIRKYRERKDRFIRIE